MNTTISIFSRLSPAGYHIWLTFLIRPKVTSCRLSLSLAGSSWLIWEWLGLAHPILVEPCLAEPSQAEPSCSNTSWLISLTEPGILDTIYGCISVLMGCLTHLGPAGASWCQLVPAGASWYNTLKLASCHVHRPCLNPLQPPHRVITSKQESSTSLASQFGKSVKCYLYD